MITKTISPIPKKIWFMWFQGIDKAPFVVKKCLESWQRLNPTWELVFLDRITIQKYIKVNMPEDILNSLHLSHQSDILRLQLLAKFGGVWVDATTLCMTPLDEWINEYATSGFFAYYKPGRDRLISNWLLVAKKDSHLIKELLRCLIEYWTHNSFRPNTKFSQKTVALLKKFLSRTSKTTRYWFHPFITKVLRVYPYLIFHYMFERVVTTDCEAKKIWQETKKISADKSHRLIRYGLLNPLTPIIKQEIDYEFPQVHKLTYKIEMENYSPNTVLYYLLEGR